MSYPGRNPTRAALRISENHLLFKLYPSIYHFHDTISIIRFVEVCLLPTSPPPEWLIVVGTSAGGLEALERLLVPIGPDLPAAVVVAQHLPSAHRSLVPDLLRRHLTIRVEIAQDGMTLQPGCVYFQPHGIEILIEGNTLRLRQGVRAPPTTVDALFTTAADHFGAKAIGVVMSGGGSDGSRGCQAIREAGGRVLVQLPGEAAFSSMPRSVITARAADEILSLADIAERLTMLTGLYASEEPTQEQTRSLLTQLIERLLSEQGLDLTGYRRAPLIRRISRLAGEARLDVMAWLEQQLAQEPLPVSLTDRLMVGTTSFFRDTSGWEALQEVLLPAMIGRKSVRMWSAGCSSGEEAYSLAMQVAHFLEQHSPMTDFKLFATDIRGDAVASAQAATWPEDRLESVPAVLRKKYLEPIGGRWRIIGELRRQVIIAQHNLLTDPPFINLDLVLCRNVLIYLERSLQEELLSRFAFTLRAGGMLWLGESEAVQNRLFKPVDRFSRLFRRIPGGVELRARLSEPRQPPRPRSQANMEQLGAQALVAAYSPPAALLSETGELLHTYAGMERYLTVKPGTVRLRIDNLAGGLLSGVLTAALAEHRRAGGPVRYEQVPISDTEQAHVVLRPVEGLLLLTIEPLRSAALPGTVGDGIQTVIDELQSQLISTQQGLKETVEALQISNEELEATNEELMSSNEELEATNEELQATNEELYAMTAEREARISELIQFGEEQEQLLNSTEIGAIFVDRELRIIKTVGSLGLFWRQDRADIGQLLSSFLDSHPITLGIRGLLEQILLDGTRREEIVPLEDGRRILLRAQPNRGRSGAFVTLMDVTPLARAREHLQEILDALPQQIAVLDHAGSLTTVNAAWRRFSQDNNGPADGFVGTSYLDAIPPEEAALRAALSSLLQGETTALELDYPCHAPDQERWFMMSARHTASGAVLSHLNITRRYRLEEQLRAERDQLHTLLQALPIPIAVVELHSSRVTSANPAMEAFTGFSKQDLQGSALDLILRSDESDRWSKLLLKLQDDPATSLPALPGWRPQINRIGPTEALLSMLPEQSSAADSLSETVRALAGGVAHELNNILMVVSALAEDALTDSAIPKTRKEDLRHMLGAGQRGREITRDLLRFAQQDTVPLKPIMLGRVVQDMAALLRRSLPDSVSMTLRVPGDGPLIRGRRAAVGQAVMNLALNAFDAMPDGGTLDISLQPATDAERARLAADEAVVLSVQDSGAGMDTETLRRARQPFFTTKQDSNGTGLGLAMVDGVVSSAGGLLEIDSAPQRGTIIRWLLPVIEAAEETTAPPPPPLPEDTLGSLTVLLVDDNPRVLRAMSRLLTTLGFQPHSYPSGPDALQALSSLSPDVAILDVQMPEMDGIELMDHLRTDRPDLPVLLYSGNVTVDTAALRNAQTTFLGKPFTTPSLLTALRGILPAS